mmetsp:Transcript_32066/g.67220  ORF Transcript_32066/g.67220 Transcript_32066/m.67220 type:complete len:221 (+) Transcript_32066:140-802(+)
MNASLRHAHQLTNNGSPIISQSRVLVFIRHPHFDPLQRSAPLNQFHGAIEVHVHVAIVRRARRLRLHTLTIATPEQRRTHVSRIVQRCPISLLRQCLGKHSHPVPAQFREIPLGHPREDHLAVKQHGRIVVFRSQKVIELRSRRQLVGSVGRPLRRSRRRPIRVNALVKQKVQWSIIKRLLVINSFKERRGELVVVVVQERRAHNRMQICKCHSRGTTEP